MLTFSADYSPLIDSSVHLDVTLVKRDSKRSTFVYFLFVRYPDSENLVALFGADHNNISVPNHHANDKAFVLNIALDGATMRYGDTDSDFFDSYTPRERVFAESWLCEALKAECDLA